MSEVLSLARGRAVAAYAGLAGSCITLAVRIYRRSFFLALNILARRRMQRPADMGIRLSHAWLLSITARRMVA